MVKSMFEQLKIKQELKKLNIPYSKIDLIQNKDRVIVARVQSGEELYIIKYYQSLEPTIASMLLISTFLGATTIVDLPALVIIPPTT